uniref:Ommochrome-binding protein-like n=1 Tax=Heliothis virescens TaxID=7102 RepID=A0A2A4K3H5_HELVI
MKLIFVLICVILGTWAKATHKQEKHNSTVCEGVHVHGKLHKRHVIMNGINRPYQLAMYNHEHKIYFSYNVGEDTQDTFGIAYVKINDTMPTEIKGIKNGFAVAVDEHNKIVYFGGSDGIYSHNLTHPEGLKHLVKDRDIWDMQYLDHHLYFIQYPSQRLHKYDAKEHNVSLQEHIKGKIYQFVIDGDGDTFITTRDGLFEIKKGANHRIPYEGPKVFRAIEVNHNGVAHFCAKSAIYVAHKANHTLIEIASIKNIFGITFDSEDHIIYSNPHEIVKLVPHDCK